MSMAIKVASIGDGVLTAEGIIGTANLLQNFDFSNDDEADYGSQTDLLTALSSLQVRNSTAREENDEMAVHFNRPRAHSQHSRTTSQDRSPARMAPRVPNKKPSLAVPSPKLQ
ncbi:hypothetical protein CHU98_g2834 [Xylaria longipes]|nr:hypothetical protein CHU98_g2834 [Xylaria longipes]